MRRLLIIARDFNAAKHWAHEHKLSPGQWVYISSFYNIQGNPGADYLKIPGWDQRPDIKVLEAALETSQCIEVTWPLQ